MQQIKEFLAVGSITEQGSKSIQFQVKSIKDLKVIIDFFDKFPLKTKKRADFILFKYVVELVIRKEHLTEEGFRKILAIKASMNKGFLSYSLKEKFPDIVVVERPKVEIPINIDPN